MKLPSSEDHFSPCQSHGNVPRVYCKVPSGMDLDQDPDPHLSDTRDPALESSSSPPSPRQKNKRESYLKLPGWNLRPPAITTAEQQVRVLQAATWSPALESPYSRHHHCRKTSESIICSFIVSGVGISVLTANTTAEKQARQLFTAS
jgi:hypothetical protein